MYSKVEQYANESHVLKTHTKPQVSHQECNSMHIYMDYRTLLI